MTEAHREPGIKSGRLSAEQLADNFGDLHPAYDGPRGDGGSRSLLFLPRRALHNGLPHVDRHPLFLRQIQAGQPKSAARTIFDQNILGGMCARVCPTETLCEEACVREAAEGKPVEIGRLQRYATDSLMATGQHPCSRAASTGKKVAVIGAGPAGLACAHRLAMKGHDVVVFEARPKPGGLNEYGIASYKTVDNFAANEVDWLLNIGGIEMVYDHALGAGDLTLDGLAENMTRYSWAWGLAV